MTWHGTEIVGEKRANALHGIDLDAFTLPRPHSLFVCGVFVTHYKDKINKVMWAFAGDALTDTYLEQAALVVDYRQGVGIGEAYGDQSMPVNPGDSLYLAFKARGFVCEEGETFPGQEDIYGWIRFEVFEDWLGVSQPTYAECERGSNMRIGTLQKVVTALGGELSFPVLIGGRDYNLQMPQPV